MHIRRTRSIQEWPSMRINSKFRRFALVGFSSTLFIASLWLTGCQPHPSIEIETGPPLRFVMSGPGRVTSFQVTGPDLEHESNRQGEGDRLTMLKVYWELAPTTAGGRGLDEIGPITYGQVPEGFVQVKPQSGTPPPLVERDLYNVRFSVNDGDGINRFFAIRDGKIVAEGER